MEKWIEVRVGKREAILAELESAISSEAYVTAGNWRVNHYATGPSYSRRFLEVHMLVTVLREEAKHKPSTTLLPVCCELEQEDIYSMNHKNI